ncbi:porphobilinogen deaminase [Serendipita vermifera]|nr:porphobilinogen deaminase [Serendipita vermifera]
MASPTQKALVIGSRASKLAQIQTQIVEDALKALHPDQPFQVQYMTTEGDKNQSQALYLLGGKALWTKELEVGLLDGSIDLIVHSLKDVPTTLPDGCELGAILQREEPKDSLVVKKGLEYKKLEDMPNGSVIGTSSVRRVALLRRAFPHLIFRDVRGNLNTRLAKLDAEDGPYSALILAAAGLERLGFGDRITSLIGPPVLYPAVGQAALGVEIRSNDPHVSNIVSALTHQPTQWTCLAERACLRVLEGGCSVPVGISSTLTEQTSAGSGTVSVLKMVGTVTSLDGQIQAEAALEGNIKGVKDAEDLGVSLANLLVKNGAESILADIKKDRVAKQAMQNVSVPVDSTQ